MTNHAMLRAFMPRSDGQTGAGPHTEHFPALCDYGSSGRESLPADHSSVASAGFTQVHVSGLPEDCDDDAVEERLTRILLEYRMLVSEGDAAHPADAADAADAAAAAPAEGERDNAVEDASETLQALHAEVAVTAEVPHAQHDATISASFDVAFVSCSVVRNKQTLACKGYCFLGFASREEALAAVECLNRGVEVAGCQVRAQLSAPKVGKKPENEEEHISDLRLRRKRYGGISKHAGHGHQSASSGRNSAGENTKTRNASGRLQVAAGTRDGRVVKTDDSKCSSRSGIK